MQELFKQTQVLIQQSQNIAIVLPRDFDLDHYLATASLMDALVTAGKNVQLFSEKTSFDAPNFSGPKLTFNSELVDYNNLVIKINSTTTQPDEIRYESKDDGLYVYVKPKSGKFTKQDVSVLGKDFTPDLFFIIGASNYDGLGAIFQQSAESFSRTPQVVIDINIDNELYGQVNLVQANYSSNCEIIFDFFKSSGMSLSQVNTKTNLLAGMMFKTDSFTDYNTSPLVFEKAAQLMAGGADKQSIVRELYKTKSLPALRLWGRVLARSTATDAGILLSTILPADFEKTQAQEKDVSESFRDLVGMADDFKAVMLVSQNQDSLRLLFAIKKQLDPNKVLQNLGIKEFSLVDLNKKYNYSEMAIKHLDLDGLLQKIQTIPADLL